MFIPRRYLPTCKAPIYLLVNKIQYSPILITSSTIFTSSEVMQCHTCCWLKRSEYCTMATQVLSNNSSSVHESCTNICTCYCARTIMYSVHKSCLCWYMYNGRYICNGGGTLFLFFPEVFIILRTANISAV